MLLTESLKTKLSDNLIYEWTKMQDARDKMQDARDKTQDTRRKT